MTLATTMNEIAEALVDKFEAAKDTLGLVEVFYGDQQKLPATPILCVEPDTKTNELKGAQRIVDIEFTVYLILYHSAVQSVEQNRREADIMAAAVETQVHLDPRLKRTDDTDRVIHCMITEVASGYATKAGTLVRSSRLTFKARSQSRLPS